MNIQEDELKYEADSTVSFFGKKVDILSVTMFSIGIAISIFIWLYFGLYKENKYNRYFLYAICIFFVTQIFTSGSYTGSYSIEDNEIKEVVQLNAVLFSSLVILISFGNFYTRHKKMLVIAIFLSLLALTHYSIKKDSKSKRKIRKLKVMFMTVSIFIFANFLFTVGVEKFELLG